MEALSFIWEFAPNAKYKLLYLSLIGQMAITVYCYMQLSRSRVAAAKANRINPDDYKATQNEPEDLRVFSRAVANQFEMPVLFYVLVLASAASSVATWLTVILAWLYVAFRLIHVREMTSENRVIRRRKIFIHSTRVLLLMMLEFIIAIIFFADF